MHVGFVNVNEEKMSKSLGNFFTIREVLESYDGETLRYFILSSHYRSPLNFSDANLDNAKNAITKLYTSIRGLKSSAASIDEVSQRLNYEQRFDAALDDDFNTPIAISILFEISKQINLEKEKDIDFASALSGLLMKLSGYLGILQNNPEDFLKQGIQLSDDQINKKISERNKARAEKNFTLSDQIRAELNLAGILLEDSEEGTTWRKK